MITATDEQVAVIRRGWMGTTVEVSPQVAGLTDFVEDRLVDLESRGELTENDLLGVVEAASQMVLAAGGPDQARDTSRRMRRTVYEFLLALDASSSEETAEDGHDGERGNGAGGPGPAGQPLPSGDLVQIGDDADAPVDLDVPRAAVDDTEPAGFWEGIGRARSSPAEEIPEADAVAELTPAVVPRAGFHLTDPVDLLAGDAAVDEAPLSFTQLGDEEPGSPLGQGDGPTAGDEEPPATGSDGRDEREPAKGGAEPEPEKGSPAPFPQSEGDFESAAAAGGGDSPTVQASSHRSDEFEELASTTPPPRAAPVQTPAAWTAKFTEAARPAPIQHEPSLVPDIWAEDGGELGAADAEDQEARGGPWAAGPAGNGAPLAADAGSSWRIRKPELAGEGARRGSSRDLPADSWQSAEEDAATEPQPDLSSPRREIEELLRRKKYDQTGAVLQQLAQDNGGRAVAELALDTGDRCRATGKRMAATSCYLAASRADPVFEEPLSRLADVCIDDRDVDLAVSYLERIARLMRVRSDIKGALRIYRKIHAIAPYRDDILDLLMRAQTTGRLDP